MSESAKKIIDVSAGKSNKRHQSRVFAMQALFQWHFTHESPNILLQDFIAEHVIDEKSVDLHYCRLLFLNTVQNCVGIDAAMTPFLDRKISLLNPVELSVLRLAIYELQNHPEVPPKVVLNEAIELAKEFGSADGYKFVNAVLNAMLKKNSQN